MAITRLVHLLSVCKKFEKNPPRPQAGDNAAIYQDELRHCPAGLTKEGLKFHPAFFSRSCDFQLV